MKILVDTHIAMWSVFDTDKLSEKAQEILCDSGNEFFYSTVSVWEIDRILICQAKAEGMKFLTHDALIPYYKEPFIISV